MRRRTFLASAALLPTLSGCAGLRASDTAAGVAEAPTASLEATTIADRALPSKVLYTLRANDGADPKAALLDRILDGGATVGDERPPLPEGQHVLYDGIVYQLSHEVIRETPATRYSVVIDVVQSSVTDAETIRFADLPEVDRKAFAEHGLASGDTIGVGTTFLYTNTEREASELVPDSKYSFIDWEDGSRAKWAVNDTTDTTVNSYEYVADRIGTAAEYGRRMRERFAFELPKLPDAQREVLDTAIENDRYAVGPDESLPSAFVSLADRLRDHGRVYGLDERGGDERDLGRSYLVQCGNEIYWTVLLVRDETFWTEN
jgi:hypothetical protein